MFGLGMPELLVILVIVVIIFGASRLPQLGEGLGKATLLARELGGPLDHGRDARRRDGAIPQPHVSAPGRG
jgi:TatA/E family protein of Tat protein translocase